MIVEPTALGIEQAAEALREGKLVAFPTDTFFALGANALNADAVSQLFEAKGRAETNPIPVLLGMASDAYSVVADMPIEAQRLAERLWPGALTVVLPARPNVPAAVTAGTGTVGVRVPDNEIARRLIETAGVPVTGTSANISGQPPCKTAAEVLAQMGDKIAFAIDAPCGEHTAPSTVISLSNGAIKIIREGSIGRREIEEALKLT